LLEIDPRLGREASPIKSHLLGYPFEIARPAVIGKEDLPAAFIVNPSRADWMTG
jgi:hypothetical protein